MKQFFSVTLFLFSVLFFDGWIAPVTKYFAPANPDSEALALGLLDCSNAQMIECGGAPVTTNFIGGSNNASEYGQGGTVLHTGYTSNEKVFEFTLTAAATITLLMETTFAPADQIDMFLIGTACEELFYLEKGNLTGTNFNESITTTLGAGTYYVVVDAMPGGGSFTISLTGNCCQDVMISPCGEFTYTVTGTTYNFSLINPSNFPSNVTWTIQGLMFTLPNFATLSYQFTNPSSFEEVCVGYDIPPTCSYQCCEFIPIINPFDCSDNILVEFTGGNYQFTLDISGASNISWTVDQPVVPDPDIGSGTTSDPVPPPANCQNYTICASYNDPTGAPGSCCRVVYMCDPLACGNSNIDIIYSAANGGYTFELTDPNAQNISWDIDGNPAGAGTISNLLPFAMPCTDVIATATYTDSQTDALVLCSVPLYNCDPANCETNIEYSFNDPSYDFTLGAGASANPNSITWYSNQLGTLGQGTNVTYPTPLPCTTDEICALFFDTNNNRWAYCCRSIFICDPFSCSNNLDTNAVAGGYEFELTVANATNITWTQLAPTMGNLGTGNISDLVPTPASCADYTVCADYFDTTCNCWRQCCITLFLCPPEDCTNGIDDDGDNLIDCQDPDCPGLPTGTLDDTVCNEFEVIINGNPYNVGNPMGQETLTNASALGCDSIVMIDLDFLPAVENTINDTLCPGDSIIVNGTVYNEMNPNGTEVITGGSANSCDSTIFVSLTYFMPVTSTLAPTLCFGEDVTVNGTVYDEMNPTGTEVITGGAANGCDSTVTINLMYHPASTNTIDPTLCPGDSVIVNGTTYNEATPSGTETVSGGASTGCDSVITVNLSFFPASTNTIDPTLCPGDSVIVNGTVYNEMNPNGTEVITGGAANGCDSTIIINLTFFPPAVNDIIQTLCTGDSIIINGTVYNEMNPMGTEIITNGSSNGCDSTINVDLTFSNASVNNINQTLCTGDSLVVNGITYNEMNPTGADTIIGGSALGCDSIINVSLMFTGAAVNNINQTLCTGDSLIVNGIIYNEMNPMGSDTLIGGSTGGCDSIINVSLMFTPPSMNTINDTLCQGDTLLVNGMVYDQNNTMGTETITGGSASGCDSIITIDLTFNAPVQVSIVDTLCPAEILVVNGTTYNNTNPSGTEVVMDGASNGCDSIIMVNLTFILGPDCDPEDNCNDGEDNDGDGLIDCEDPDCDTDPNCILPLVLADTLIQDIACNGDSTGAITITVEGGLPPFLATWTGPDGYMGNGATISQLAAGTYTGTITDAQDSMLSFDLFIQEPTPIIIDLVVTPSGCDQPTGTVMGAASGGTPGYTYLLTNNGSNTTGNFNNLQAGSYIFGVMDDNGCVVDSSFILEQLGAPDVDIVVSDTITCASDSITITITGGQSDYTYGWQLDGNNLFMTMDTEYVVDTGGTYTLTTTDSSGCQGFDVIDLAFQDDPEFFWSIPDSNTICDNDILTLSPTITPPGDYTLNWDPGGIGDFIDVSDPGTYSVTVTSDLGCSNSDEIHVDVVDISFDLGPDTTACPGDEVVLEGIIANNVIYDWVGISTDPNISVTTAGTYELNVTDTLNNCMASDMIIVNFEAPVADLGTDFIACVGEDELLDPGSGPGNTYLWSDGSMGSTLAVNQSNAYWVQVTNAFGCVNGDTINALFQTPTFSLGEDITECLGNQVTVGPIIGPGTYTFNWNTGETDSLIMLDSTQTVFLTITDTAGCEFTDTLQVSLTAPMVEFDQEFVACGGDDITVMPSVNPGDYTYIWNTGDNSPSITVSGTDTSFTYSITVTELNNPDCFDSDTVEVFFVSEPLAEISATNVILCGGTQDTLFGIVSPGSSFDWTAINGEIIEENQEEGFIVYSLTQQGTFILTTTNPCGEDTDSITLDILPSIATAGPDSCGRKDLTFALYASGGVTYNWSDPMGLLSNTTIASPSFKLTETVSFAVEITDENGCTITDSVTVSVVEDPEDAIIFINTFSPNGDGVNDFFDLKGLEKFPQNKLEIYNRWGELVYQKFQYKNDWDGTFKDAPLPAGVYFYLLEIEDFTHRSSITILRN